MSLGASPYWSLLVALLPCPPVLLVDPVLGSRGLTLSCFRKLHIHTCVYACNYPYHYTILGSSGQSRKYPPTSICSLLP